MPKNMGKPEFSVKISKNLTTFMHFEIQNFGKVLKISGRIMEKFQLFMEIYTPDPHTKKMGIFPPIFTAPSDGDHHHHHII